MLKLRIHLIIKITIKIHNPMIPLIITISRDHDYTWHSVSSRSRQVVGRIRMQSMHFMSADTLTVDGVGLWFIMIMLS